MHKHNHKHATRPQSDPAGPTTPAQTAVIPGDGDRNARPVSAEDIRLRAYRKWEGAGRPAGDGVRFWLEAEQELTRGR